MSTTDPNKKVGLTQGLVELYSLKKNGIYPEADSQNPGVDLKLIEYYLIISKIQILLALTY